MKTFPILFILVTAFNASSQDIVTLEPGQSITIKAAAAPTVTPTAVPTPTSHVHIYDMSQPASALSISNPNVDGGLIKIHWNKVEPTQGQFNWASIDNFMAPINAADKEFELDFPAGAYVPDWAYSNPVVEKLDFIWSRPWNFPICSTQKVPLPWDSNFIAKFLAFVDAVAYRYGSNYKLARVKITGVNGDTDELGLPRAQGESINNGQCTANDDIANWLKAGYTPDLALESFNLIARHITNAFSNVPADAMVVRWGFPSDVNQPSPGPSVAHIEAACRSIIRCDMQNNGWKPTQLPIPNMKVYQEGAPMGTNLPQGIDLALSQSPVPEALEIDDNDIQIPSNQVALAKAHGTPAN